MKKVGPVLILTLLLVFGGTNGFALPIIDFADNKFAAVAGETKIKLNNVYGSLDIEFEAVSPNFKKLTHNPGPGGGIDGIGIGDDEVSKEEFLILEFSTSITISKLYITDLFHEGNPSYNEQGKYNLSVDGSNWLGWQLFEAPPGNLPYNTTNGELEIDIVSPMDGIKAIQFTAPYYQKYDFSVRGIDASVPEPVTMLLLGLGLVGIAGLRRKFENNHINHFI